MTSEKILQAATATGKTAFENGKPCTPALDPNCMTLIEIHGRAIDILDAWIAAWTKANLATP